MNRHPLTVVLLGLICCSLSVSAQVYRSVDKNGNVIFTDKPSPDSKKVHVAPVQTYTLPTKPKKPDVTPSATTPADAPAGDATVTKPPKRYKIAFVSPENDAVVRQNAGSLTVNVSIKPDLFKTDKIQFSLNGEAVGEPASGTSAVIPFVDRGTHTIGAKVLSAAGTVKGRASSVTVHMKRIFVTN